jgi:hypothetical protein
MEISNMMNMNLKEAKTGHNVDIPQRFGAASQGARQPVERSAAQPATTGEGIHRSPDDSGASLW